MHEVKKIYMCNKGAVGFFRLGQCHETVTELSLMNLY